MLENADHREWPGINQDGLSDWLNIWVLWPEFLNDARPDHANLRSLIEIQLADRPAGRDLVILDDHVLRPDATDAVTVVCFTVFQRGALLINWCHCRNQGRMFTQSLGVRDGDSGRA